MKLSISNLSWSNNLILEDIFPRLESAGLNGIEIAPTKVWPDIKVISKNEVSEFRNKVQDHNLSVSGVQSLLFGHPEYQLFQRSSWDQMLKHLESMIEVGGLLGASVAVFGSPKNRLKGKLTSSEANELAAEFLSQLIPCLEENKVTLTLEPNAPEYGADFLVNYEDVVALSNLIDSESIRPQIDTGCLWMVGVESHEAFKFMKPKHIHLSTPFLGPVPGERKFDDLLTVVKSVDYKGWLVIETLESAENNFEKIIDSAKWLANWEQS